MKLWLNESILVSTIWFGMFRLALTLDYIERPAFLLERVLFWLELP